MHPHPGFFLHLQTRIHQYPDSPATTQRRLIPPCRHVAFPITTLPPLYVFLSDFHIFFKNSVTCYSSFGLGLMLQLHRSGWIRHLTYHLILCLYILQSSLQTILTPFQHCDSSDLCSNHHTFTKLTSCFSPSHLFKYL